MGKGLGRIQKEIIRLLKFENNQLGVGSLTYQLVNGDDCFRLERDDPRHKTFREPTESEKQSVWRAVRSLEKRKLIKSSIRMVTNFEFKCGGCVYSKVICLVHFDINKN